MNNRCTDLLIDVDVEMMLPSGKVENFRLGNIPCVWKWDESSREAAEYWAAFDHIGDNYNFDWMSIKSWTGSPVDKPRESVV